MEISKKNNRNPLWEEIYAIIDQLNIQHSESDGLDRLSAAKEIEQAVRKLIFDVELMADAEDFLTAIETWNDREMLGGMKGHKLVNMRPILLAKNVCKKVLKKNETQRDI